MKILCDTEFLDLIKKQKKFSVIIEDRKGLGFQTYGIDNHAEFIHFHNPHDDCLWDAVIPGYKKQLPFDKIYKTKDIIGLLWLSNGNHKIFIRLNTTNYGFKVESINSEIKKFIKNYVKINKGLQYKYISKSDIGNYL